MTDPSHVPTTEAAVTTMQAAVLEGNRQTSVQEVARPEPDAGEVRVRLDGCGVCASDRPVWDGRSWFEYPQPPGAPGHEGWGRIDAVGAGVERVDSGDRVAVLSEQAYAEYDIASADAVVPLPDSLAGHPFPGEPLGCAMNVFRRSDIEAGQTVAVVGAGFLGTLLVGLAAEAGAHVFATSRRRFALEMAEQFGAERTASLSAPDAVVEQVMKWTSGDGCDCVIEATGKQGALDLASRLPRVRGRLVIAGYHQDGPRTVDMQQWNWKGLDVINAHERDPKAYTEGIRAAVRAVESGRIDPSPLFTHTFRLDQIDEAFRLQTKRPDGFMKALLLA